MNMFEHTGTFTPDSLIASNEFPILKEGIGLKAGQGVLKRGSLIIKATTGGAGYIAGTKTGTGEDATDIPGKIFGILTDNTDTGSDATADNIPATCYQTGIFNPSAVIVTGEGETVNKYKDDMRGLSLFLRSVQDYE